MEHRLLEPAAGGDHGSAEAPPSHGMAQLSGGQRTMLSLALILAVIFLSNILSEQ